MKTRIFVISFLLVILSVSGGSGLAAAQESRFGVSVLGGGAWATDSDPLEGRDGYTGPASSSFDGTWTLGAEALWQYRPGICFGLGVQHWKMTAQAARTGGSERDFLSVKATPVYALVRFLAPLAGGISWHAEAGAGVSFNSSDKEASLYAMETGLGEPVDLDMDNAFSFFLGVGADYFFTPSTSLGLSLRHWWTEADYDLSSASLGAIERGSISGDNFQALITVTWWF